MSSSVMLQAKRHVKKKFPHLKGKALRVMVAAFYRAMGGSLNKSEPLLLQKAAQLGSSHTGHKWLRREGSPGNWKYVYDQESDSGPSDGDGMDSDYGEGGQGNDGDQQAEMQATTGSGSGAPQDDGSARAGRVLLPSAPLQASEIRDATPEDLEKPRFVLWISVSEQAASSIRQQKRYIGAQRGKSILFATRTEALQNAPREPEVLLAVRVKARELKPNKPAENLSDALFNADPTIGGFNPGAVMSVPIAGNQIVAIVRPDNSMWPQVAPRPDTEGDV